MAISVPHTAALAMVLSLAATCDAAAAKQRPAAARGQIRIAYELPKNPEHRAIHEQLKAKRVLEKFQMLLAPLRLPRLLRLKLAGCDGVANAWFEDDAVTVCYEYIDEVVRTAPKETTPEGISPLDAVVGPTIEVFLHEIGHAVFDFLDVPIFGREEDAADQFAAYLLLQLGKAEARGIIAGIAFMYAQQAKQETPGQKQFADAHGLPAQRLYNLLCIAYGAFPKDFAEIVDKGYLPPARAEGCSDEYEQVAKAFRKLIKPHLNRAQAERLRRRSWLR